MTKQIAQDYEGENKHTGARNGVVVLKCCEEQR